MGVSVLLRLFISSNEVCCQVRTGRAVSIQSPQDLLVVFKQWSYHADLACDKE